MMWGFLPVVVSPAAYREQQQQETGEVSMQGAAGASREEETP